MADALQDWLGTHLGVLLDMSPQKFGRNTKDGKLLAKLLFNYGVIPVQILNKIQDCTTCYECYKNLTTLRPWLEYIGVSRDDATYQKMAGSDGSAAVSVFYDVYLNLERKDRLRYVSAEKEKRFEDGSCSRFKVDWVPEKELRSDPKETETTLAMPLVDNIDLIKHHEEKCKKVVEKIKAAKKKFERISRPEAKKPGPMVSKYVTSQSLNKPKSEAEETMADINKFSKIHPEPCGNLNYTQLVELKKKFENAPCALPCEEKGKAILGNIKRRKRGEVYAKNFQRKVQNVLVENLWKRIVEKQDKDFEDKVCANLLKQSQYEKQMMTKLQLIKHQKKVIAENRRKLECLKIEQQQKEYDDLKYTNETIQNENEEEEEEFEKKRISDLHRRAYDAKARMRNARLRKEAEKIFLALVDVAIRIAEIREETGCLVPKTCMKDMKELFFKDLPIFDILEHIEELCEDKTQTGNDLEFYGEGEGSVDFFQVSGSYDQMKCQEKERQNTLDECDLNDYINLSGPWMVELLFPDSSETEGKHLVLGYIVHKILGIKYPNRNPRGLVQIKQMKPTAVVKGLNNANALEMLTDLMELCNILVVKIADVINFVLLAYKESGENDFDIKIPADGLKEKIVVKEKEENKKLQLLKKTDNDKTEIEHDTPFADKQTQTPRMIPEEDNVLQSTAEIGKLAFEALGAGDPVPDPVIISAIVEYIKSKQNNYVGWVLIDYPVLYSQARDLEYSLVGHYTLPVLEEMETLEDAEGFTYRGPWGDAFKVDFGGRDSRLVPKPECFRTNITDVPRTYFHAFIRMNKVPPSSNPTETDEELLEKFYTEQDIFINFEYQSLNFQTIKNLGKVILNSESDSVSAAVSKTSVECFGDGVLELNEKWERKKKTEKEPTRGAKSVTKGTVSLVGFDMVETVGELDLSAKETSEGQVLPILPGEPGWEWAEGPQPAEYLIALANLWENMETVYLEDLKTVFFCLRAHRSNLLTYKACLRQSIRKLMRRPDEKQEVLSSFQKMYNEIDPDLRPDTDVKCELHVRVSELEQALMNIADERKMNSIRDMTKVAQDGWVPDEMAHIINTYLTALQLEADRCIDTVQVIMDYYTLLDQKIPEEKQLEKVTVPTIVIQNGKYTVPAWSNKSFASLSPKASDLKRGRMEPSKERLRTRSLTDRKRRSSDGSDLPNAAEIVMQMLMSLTLPEDSLTPFHNFFIDNVKFVSSQMKYILDECVTETKRNDRGQITAKGGKSGKKTSDVKMIAVNPNLIAEWSSALEDEINRFFFRSKLLLSRGVFEINEFLTTILNLLSSLMDDIKDIYMKEIHSISECCKVIRCSIEEERRIEFGLELKEDEFIVNMDEFIVSSYEDEYSSEKEIDRKFMFSVEQLALLRSKLHSVAPDGEIIKRSMIYIFQDLKMMNAEAGPVCFSKLWDDIEPQDLVEVFNFIYLNLEIVNWKDFIVYALALPVPSVNDILSTRNSFRKYDPLSTELCHRDSYEKVHFWFETCLAHSSLADRYEKAKAFLFEMYRVDENHTNYTALLLAFCKDENPVEGFIKALALAEGKKIKICVSEVSLVGEDPGEYLFDNFKPRNLTLSSWKRNSTHHCPLTLPRFDGGKLEDEEGMTGEGGEGDSFFYDLPYQSGVSFVSFNILSSLLKASFPSLPQLSVLLDCSQTFQDTLNSIYDSLKPVNGKVEVDKLIKNKLIDRLIHSTNKFKSLNLSVILQAEVSIRKTSVCASDRLALMKCLNEKEKVLS